MHVTKLPCAKDEMGNEILNEERFVNRINSRDVVETIRRVRMPDGSVKRTERRKEKHDPLPPPLAGVWGS